MQERTFNQTAGLLADLWAKVSCLAAPRERLAPLGVRLRVAGIAVACWLGGLGVGSAQQVQVSTPFQGVTDSFYENIGTSWGFRSGGANGGVFFNFGGGNPGIPPFGGFDPNAGARFGVGGRWGGGAFSLRGFAGQGSSRTLVSETPTVVIPNGGTGAIFSGAQRPFVTGIVPVVGQRNLSPLLERLQRLRQQPAPTATATNEQDVAEGRPQADSAAVAGGVGGNPEAAGPVADRSTARHGDLSVAEIRRQREARLAAETAERRAEVERLIERGRGCEQAGKLGAARIYYKQAARQADGPLREKLLEHVRGLQR